MNKLLILFLLTFVLLSCSKEKKEYKEQISTKITSSGTSDGYIVNAQPKQLFIYNELHDSNELLVGWDLNGYNIRSFLSFNLNSILPNTGEHITLEKVELVVFESSITQNPFTSEGVRSIEAYIIDYNRLVTSLYDASMETHCGTIVHGSDSLSGTQTLDITRSFAQYMEERGYLDEDVEFRFQFTRDSNVDQTSPLRGSKWGLYAKHHQNPTDFHPVLKITYTKTWEE